MEMPLFRFLIASLCVASLKAHAVSEEDVQLVTNECSPTVEQVTASYLKLQNPAFMAPTLVTKFYITEAHHGGAGSGLENYLWSGAVVISSRDNPEQSCSAVLSDFSYDPKTKACHIPQMRMANNYYDDGGTHIYVPGGDQIGCSQLVSSPSEFSVENHKPSLDVKDIPELKGRVINVQPQQKLTVKVAFRCWASWKALDGDEAARRVENNFIFAQGAVNPEDGTFQIPATRTGCAYGKYEKSTYYWFVTEERSGFQKQVAGENAVTLDQVSHSLEKVKIEH